MICVELAGLELFGHHGVREEERRAGQPFLYDVKVHISATALSDRLEDTVDYSHVAACVREVSRARQFRLLETLAAAVADTILERFPAERVQVRVRKPTVRPAGLAVEYAAASVERP
ncbi:MAG: dihydroneopterin aldolase [Actinomycetota bacterium]|nr:dihydroneopterin aldolase [Actinomycetota bacterium]